MVDIEKSADRAIDAIDAIREYGQQTAEALERIADLARKADEDNWRNVIDQIFDIAYNNY